MVSRQPEVPLRPRHIFEDLLLQGFRGGPLDFAAEAEQEFEFERSLVVERDGFRIPEGLEVEDVGLYGEGGFAEGGAVAEVGDSLKCAPVYVEPRDVDTEGREQAAVGREIDGGQQQAGTDAAAAGGRGEHGEGTAEHPACAAHVAGGDERANG